MKKLIVAAAILAASAVGAQAETRFSVGYGKTWQDMDNHDRDHAHDYHYNHPAFEDGTMMRLAVTKDTTVRWIRYQVAYELGEFSMGVDNGKGKSYDLQSHTVSLALCPTLTLGRFHLYPIAGLGLMYVDPGGGYGVSRTFGAGLDVDLTEHWGISTTLTHTQGIWGPHNQVTDCKYTGAVAGLTYRF